VAVAVLALGAVALPSVGQAQTVPARTKPLPKFYLSLGDSYSVGYQPGIGATAGYTAYVAKKTKTTLENFGCGGATTTSILTVIGCTSPYGPTAATDAVAYPSQTQEQAAVAFIDANPGRIGLVTVSIGGNDVTACAVNSDPLPCVAAAASTIKTNVTSLVDTLDAALTAHGDTTQIVGLTYPDVILGEYVYPAGDTDVNLAQESVAAFDDLINPTLDTAYTSVSGGSFVNVTQAPYKKATAGDDTALTTLVKLAPYGKIPAAVWEICTLTYFCSSGNIHANTKGYTFIADLAVKDYDAS
jgi:lysophospholipase L1-like esterase